MGGWGKIHHLINCKIFWGDGGRHFGWFQIKKPIRFLKPYRFIYSENRKDFEKNK